ncbi:conserved hypothetical protein [Leishmania mexicana MHOM/GT/2001/U1103]|uniref:Uncharacterized protein n=1 Tax=Leishmania mexicana (strain MHOM/GT/2001/U1103) TaxID=929439 RepID=E9AL24_LEIMU|nr:conserved hypothetical protein [Leishmania mexicana MHOM/GT/2001/U1103]CBZ23627.1 conserved hypothetical protein [Leishmania mexicana MHOM/GT/2001/U1103]
MLLSSPVARAAQKAPVTAGLLVFMCLILLLSSSKDLTCMHSVLYELFPWRFITYPLAVTMRQPLRIAVNTAVILAGASAEAATGSSEYATFLLCTTVATGALVLLTDLVIFHPLRLTVWGGNDSHNRPYGYTGMWPVAEVVGFSLCRVRGVSALVGPRLRCGQLTLQRVPLAFVWAAFGCDVVSLVMGHSAENYYEHREGWQVMVAGIALLVSWLYERRVTGASNSAFALEAFMYPDPLRDGARWVCGRLQRRLQASPLRFLLPPEGGVGGGAAALPTPLFTRAAIGNTFPGSASTAAATTTTALLPGTTAEEAERHRLIAREALARRLQQQQQSASASSAAEVADSAAKTA